MCNSPGQLGYAAVIVDSFGPRNVRSVCESPRTVGFSHGGSTAHFAAIEERIPVDRGGRPFQAAVAYYPYCAAGTVVSPLPRTRWS